MPGERTTTRSGIDRFWDRYIEEALRQGVEETVIRWYVSRAEAYVTAIPDKRLTSHTAADVERYLEQVGRLGRLEDWQFRQMVDAIQILFHVVGGTVTREVDWTFWRDSARSLGTGHATIARDAKSPGAPEAEVSGQRFSAKRNTPSLLDSVRAAHGAVLERLVAAIRRRKYSIRTEQAYESWVCRFIAFHGGRPPAGLGAAEVVAFLEDLAVRGHVAASTQNQALNALVFLYGQVLDLPLEALDGFARAKRPQRLPVVLERGEVRRLLQGLDGVQHLMAALLYGTGMRLMECVRLRVQDVDFAYRQLLVRDGKGQKDRVVPLPQRLEQPLRDQLARARRLREEDLANGFGEVYRPDALSRKWRNAPLEWGWQDVFPSGRLSVDPRSGKSRRHHLHENGLQKAVKKAAVAAGIANKGELPLSAPLVRHASIGGRLRHTHRAGAPRPCGCLDHHDLYACPQPRRAGGVEPVGRLGVRMPAEGIDVMAVLPEHFARHLDSVARRRGLPNPLGFDQSRRLPCHTGR